MSTHDTTDDGRAVIRNGRPSRSKSRLPFSMHPLLTSRCVNPGRADLLLLPPPPLLPLLPRLTPVDLKKGDALRL